MRKFSRPLGSVHRGVKAKFRKPVAISYCFIVITLALTAACDPLRTKDRYALLEGPAAELDSTDIEGFANRQSSAAANLLKLAGLESTLQVEDRRWKLAVDAGVLYVDKVCDDYIGALFWFDRWRDSTKNSVALTGAATAAALGIVSVSAEAVALTATAFGLTTGLIDTGANTVLYSIEVDIGEVIHQRW